MAIKNLMVQSVSSPSPKIPQELPRYEPVHHERAHEETTIAYGHNPQITI